MIIKCVINVTLKRFKSSRREQLRTFNLCHGGVYNRYKNCNFSVGLKK